MKAKTPDPIRSSGARVAGAETAQPPTSGPFEAFPDSVHLLGAGGAGVSGIGRILNARGVQVTGHDRAESQILRALRDLDLPLELGVSRAQALPPQAELVVRSAAVPETDPQVVAARERGIPVIKYAEALARIAPRERLLAVAGTHGKTTVSWMLWYALEGIAECCGDPVAGALIGGICRRLGTNALAGSRESWFCVEACEYDRTFLHLEPRGAIVTNVEEDHLDCYGTLDALHCSFARFLEQVSSEGLVVLGREVPEALELGASSVSVWRMGREIEVDLLGEVEGCFRFRLRGPGWATPAIQLTVPGHFNVENAGLALALAIGLGARETQIPVSALAEAAATGIERFGGVQRRFEPWGSAGGVDIVHDYAHHPTEVRVTIEAALRAYPRYPLHVLFQPHQHSRTARFLTEFAECLRSADHVLVSDVYGARSHMEGERQAGAPELVEELQARHVPAALGGDLISAVQRLVDSLPEAPRRATALILGAGDVELIRDDLLRQLALRGTS